ncbi:MAG TPA: 6,7-dimethyl-8-ribityllumazine synthase [Acidimicrobiia bacterium]|jgi:6,7-dimethyl-8-ribityllumazine synthase|nr:6,7-dimethyl-8-ribityllumazine synthase [Acidimicrobiia bacterium]
MSGVFQGSTDATGLHVGVAAARWNQTITDRLLEGAITRLEELGADEVTVLRVPGALELPLACRQLATNGCDAVVAIGAVVKGETDHYDIVVHESARGLTLASLETGVPITNAILAVHDYQHAIDRAGKGADNKGVEGVDAAIALATALRELGST